MLEGARITEFVFWPTPGYWGFVSWEGPVTAATLAAPYLVDFLTFGVFFAVCMLVRFKRRWVWLNLVAIGILSPLINSLHNYWWGLQGPNDVGTLLISLPENLVHGYFWLTISGYLVGLVMVFSLSRTAGLTSNRNGTRSKGDLDPLTRSDDRSWVLKSIAKIRLVLLAYVLMVILVSLLPSSGVSVGQIDKVGHFLAYGGMAILVLLSFKSKSCQFAGLLGSVGLGALLEWGQSFIPGRDMSLLDGLVNALGVFSGALFFRFRGQIWLDWIRSRLNW